ncbi:MAG: helix-turn-helix domain-containing protein [Propionibacteriaceae bacterium]|jgi:transcriptional regulator with XRE-family HTH domain|nr:helix-turn-helix domain-containing protein [Propionibacteriaceae bacterium]
MSVTLEQQLAHRPIDPAELEEMVQGLQQQVRAHRLRELRQAQSKTQVEMAGELGVGQNRVSAIERGDLDQARVSTLRRYVEALGGRLSIEADFGDTRYVIAE